MSDVEVLYADFPEEEYVTRWKKAQDMMAKDNIDALFITEEHNYVYFTGHRSMQNKIDTIREYAFILPRNGAPVVVTMPFEVGHVLQATWVKDVREYREMYKHNDLFVQTIEDMGLGDGVIGAELGREQYLQISYNDFNDLRNRLPKAKFVDAAQMLLDLRAVKSPAEVEMCRKASVIGAKAIEHLFEVAKEGMTGHELAKIVRMSMAQEGADSSVVFVMAGFDFTGRMGMGVTCPTDRRLRRHDTVCIDVQAEYKGYCCDIARTFAVGEALREQKDMYRFTYSLTRRCIDQVRPSIRAEDIKRFCNSELEKLGKTTAGVGRIGHGVGVLPTEYPSFMLGEKTVLQAGMVFALNPNFTTPFGLFNAEDNLVVTRSGYEILSKPECDPELIVI
nr:Xaa-Pro peptidase family protein [Candidatus Njordarchaeum guaymaensis]